MDEAPPSRFRAILCNRNLIYFLVTVGGMEAASLVYSISLRGGSVGYIQENMALLGVCMVLATLLMLVATVTSVFFLKSIRVLVKLAALVCGWALFLRTALADTDTTLINHGHYNLAVFILVFVVGFLLSALGVLAAKLVKTVNPVLCWGSVLVVTVSMWSIWIVASSAAFKGWNKGISSSLDLEWPNCSLDFHSVPWLSIIPTRTLNFFSKLHIVGSNDCPEINEFASLAPDGTLRLQCEAGDVTITEYPDFMKARKSWWILDECGLNKWQDRVAGKEVKYNFPGNGRTQIRSEYFQVFCGNEENYFVQNTKNEDLIEKLSTLPQENRMNLIVFQIDNLSRAHFIRTMKETASKLREFRDKGVIEIVEMLRMVTVGFNTEFNTKAMYTGSQFRQDRGGRPYWDIFHSQGNVAAYINGTFHSGFCEDWANRFLKRDQFGIDHYVFMPWCHPDYHPYEHTFSLLSGVNSLRRRCIKGHKVHERIFQYLFSFWDNYAEFGKVVHIPLQEAHESSGAVITTLDPGFADFLEEMNERGELNKTIIVIASDHGNHMTPYYPLSDTGALEQVMPGVTYIFPQEFARKYPDLIATIKDNEQRLAVHFDTYWTLRHLSSLPEYGGKLHKEKHEEFTSLWDCQANERYMQEIWYFRGKEFSNTLGWKNYDLMVNLVFAKLKQCVVTYTHPEPAEDPMKHEITLTTSSGSETIKNIYLSDLPSHGSNGAYYLIVQNFIKDYDAMYWFEDAVSDMEYFTMRFKDDQILEYVNTTGDHEDEVVQEAKAGEEFAATGVGRYIYGHSLLQYASDRNCNTTGVWECPCKT